MGVGHEPPPNRSFRPGVAEAAAMAAREVACPRIIDAGRGTATTGAVKAGAAKVLVMAAAVRAAAAAADAVCGKHNAAGGANKEGAMEGATAAEA